MAELTRELHPLRQQLSTAYLYADAQVLGFDNPVWDAASFRVLFIRLSPWKDVNRSTPHLFLYSLMRSTLGSSAFGDFAFFPSKSDRNILDKAGLPYLYGVTSGRTAEDFDALLFSCSYALELVNLPLYLIRSGIPVKSSVRRTETTSSGSPRWPLLVMGGSNMLAGQAILFEDGDSFVDALYFGEAEAGGAEFFNVLAETRSFEVSLRLQELEKRVPALWACGFRPPETMPGTSAFRPVTVGRSLTTTEPFIPVAFPRLNSPEASTHRLQLSWGCPSFCSFCFEAWERKPYREVAKDRLLSIAREVAARTGASTLELYAFNFNTHKDILELIFALHGIFDRVNMMSQRADILQKTQGMLECELASEKRSFTVGIEGISASMRSYYSKGLDDKSLVSLLEDLIKAKVRELKLFYILSGIETEIDIEEFGAFCARLRTLIDDQRGTTRVIMSASYLVRMPFTPIRAAALELDRERAMALASKVSSRAREQGFEFRMAMSWAEYTADQLLVAGSYTLAEGLNKAARFGTLYDGGIQGELTGFLIGALVQGGELDPSSSMTSAITGPLITEKPPGHRYPLSFVSTGVTAHYLDSAYAAAVQRNDRGTCLGNTTAEGHCLGCSACVGEAERSFLTQHKVHSDAGSALAESIAALVRKKRRSRPVYLKIRLGSTLSGAVGEYLSAYLLSTVLLAEPALIGRLFRIEEALWSSPSWKDRMGSGIYGETVIALYGISSLTSGGEPQLSEDDREKARICLEQNLGFPISLLDSFDALKAEPRQLSIQIDVRDRESALNRLRTWLKKKNLAFIEKKTTPESIEDEDLRGRLFQISKKDLRKRIITTVETQFFKAERSKDLPLTALFLVEGGTKLDISPLFPKLTDRIAAKIDVKNLYI